jgi:hypothetical protein
MHFVGVDVQVYFDVSPFQHFGQFEIQFRYLVHFGHESHARLARLGVPHTFAMHFAKQFATIVAVDVNHNGQHIVRMPFAIDSQSFRIATQVDASFGRLCFDKLSYFFEIDWLHMILSVEWYPGSDSN